MRRKVSLLALLFVAACASRPQQKSVRMLADVELPKNAVRVMERIPAEPAPFTLPDAGMLQDSVQGPKAGEGVTTPRPLPEEPRPPSSFP